MERSAILRGLFCLIVSLLVTQNVTSARDLASVRFDKLETFLSGQSSSIHHIEVDLYKNDGSLLFSDYRLMKSTNGKTTETIVGSTTSGYQEGRETSAQFAAIFGFKQINSTHVAIADRDNHCIRMLNRKTQTTSRLAGVCKAHGFTNGKSGKFYYPWGIEIDQNNPEKLLVTDHSNSALRSVQVPTGEISTMVSTGLKYPRGLSWNSDKTSLFIINAHYISEVKFDINSTVISNVILAGSTAHGSTEGAFKSARFSNPYGIAPISKNLDIVADYSNSRVRILDALTNRTVPVCLSSATTCNYLSVSRLYSVLVVGTDVYIGSSKIIYKLSGYQCQAQNITAYIPAYKDEVKVEISDWYDAVLPVGTHKYIDRQRIDGYCKEFFINVQESTVVKMLSFQMKYDVKCSSVESHIAKAFLLSALAHRTGQFLKLCGSDCKMSEKIQPFYTCEKDVMTVTWPTNQMYPQDVTSVPEGLSFKLRKDLKSSALMNAEMFILSHNPPLVMPKKNADGVTVDVVIYSKCLDKSKTYQKSGDKCV